MQPVKHAQNRRTFAHQPNAGSAKIPDLPIYHPGREAMDGVAATLKPEELLLYRSNLLGSDKRITNYGGGNTSAKIPMADPLTGETVDVLWVKGSGGDIGSMKLDGFSTLYLDKLHALIGRYT